MHGVERDQLVVDADMRQATRRAKAPNRHLPRGPTTDRASGRCHGGNHNIVGNGSSRKCVGSLMPKITVRATMAEPLSWMSS